MQKSDGYGVWISNNGICIRNGLMSECDYIAETTINSTHYYVIHVIEHRF